MPKCRLEDIVVAGWTQARAALSSRSAGQALHAQSLQGLPGAAAGRRADSPGAPRSTGTCALSSGLEDRLAVGAPAGAVHEGARTRAPRV